MNISMAGSWKQTLNRRLDRPFARLVRHAVDRIFSGSETAEPGELDLGIGTILAMLAAPGAFVSLLVSDRYGSLLRFLRSQPVRFDPYTASVPDEYFFIVLAMVVAGAVAVWKWDRLLPDRRDFANFAPLPIANRAIFFANMSAILLLAVILSFVVNAASCILFPLFVTAQEPFRVFLKFFATHAIALLMASAFGFLSVFAVLGATMAILPFRVYRKLSFYLRCGFIYYLVPLLTTGLTVPRHFASLAGVLRPWTRVPPTAWFLGLCEAMRGRSDAVFASLGGAAIWALSAAIVLSMAAYSLSYRRCYMRSAELAETRPAGGSPMAFAFRWFDQWLLKGAVERGCYRFVLRTIFRSEEHTFVFGAFATLGVVVAAQTMLTALAKPMPSAGAIPSPALLSVPLIFGYFFLLGLYSAFAIPAPLRSNWVFRFTLDPETRRCVPLARKIAFTFLVPLLVAPCLVVYSYYWGWQVGVLHTVVVATWCALLLEGLLVRFRKIPFTCSLPAFKNNAIVAALLLVMGFFVFTSATSTVENWALGEPISFLGFAPIVLGVSYFLYRQRKGLIESDRRLIFEERAVPTVEAMNLVR